VPSQDRGLRTGTLALLYALFSGVRGRAIFGSPLAGSCMNRPPEPRGWLLRPATPQGDGRAGWTCTRVSLHAPGEPSARASRSGTRCPRWAPPCHVLRNCNELARYDLPLRGARRRTQDRRECRARGLLGALPLSEGSTWTGCSPPVNQARYAMAGHRGIKLDSSEHVEDHCRELRLNGFLKNSHGRGFWKLRC
jgi:hypothetical protein